MIHDFQTDNYHCKVSTRCRLEIKHHRPHDVLLAPPSHPCRTPRLQHCLRPPSELLPYNQPFPPHSQVLLLITPQGSPAKDTQIAQASLADTTSACHIDNPINRSMLHTSCATPSKAWTTCLLGRTHSTHTAHGLRQVLFLFVPCFPFVLDLPVSVPAFSCLLTAFTIEHRYTFLTLFIYTPTVAHLEIL